MTYLRLVVRRVGAKRGILVGSFLGATFVTALLVIVPLYEDSVRAVDLRFTVQGAPIARALVHEPGYLLADEPIGELDTATGASVLRLLRDVANGGTSVIVASHDPAVLEREDRAFFVSSGEVHAPDRDELSLWLTEGEGLSTG